MQETFLQAWKSIERFDGSCRISSWLCQIAKHLLYRHYQKSRREIPAEPQEFRNPPNRVRPYRTAADPSQYCSLVQSLSTRSFLSLPFCFPFHNVSFPR